MSAAPNGLSTATADEFWHQAISRIEEIADDDAQGRYGRLAREAAEHLSVLRSGIPALAQAENDPQTAFNLGFRAAGGGCHLPPSAEALFQSWLRDGFAVSHGREREEEIPAAAPQPAGIAYTAPQPTAEQIKATLKAHLKIGGHDAWEGHYYYVDGIDALSSTPREAGPQPCIFPKCTGGDLSHEAFKNCKLCSVTSTTGGSTAK